MSVLLQFRLRVACLAVAVGCLVCLVVSGSFLDRAAFSGVLGCFANPPFFMTGNGSRTHPWQVRTLSAEKDANPKLAPLMVSLGDDLNGVFQNNPPSPIDMAVVLKNFQRFGVKRAATSIVLAWDAPDVIGLAALEKTMEGFESLVVATPLTRNAVPQSLPPAFRRASLALESLHGDVSQLPLVNSVPLAGVVFGGERTLAGFQQLETCPAAENPYLLARWDERVVLAFPLLVVCQRLGISLEHLNVRLGESIKIGPNGPVVPIDSFGRLACEPQFIPPAAQINAESIIDATRADLPAHLPEPWIFADARTRAEPATRHYTRTLPSVIAAISSEAGLGDLRTFSRLPLIWEILSFIGMAGLLAWLVGLPCFRRQLGLLLVALASIASIWIGLGLASAWLPGIPALAAVAAVWLYDTIVSRSWETSSTASFRSPPSEMTPTNPTNILVHPTQEPTSPTPQAPHVPDAPPSSAKPKKITSPPRSRPRRR